MTTERQDGDAINVVAAVRSMLGENSVRKYWVCRRTAHGAHGGLAGMWEYPGGKVEEGEDLETALHREILEEFGATIRVEGLLDVVTTETGGRFYRVHFFAVTFQDEPTLRVHDAAEWFAVADLGKQDHLPSGREFNRRLLAR